MTDRAEILHDVIATCSNHAADRMQVCDDLCEQTDLYDVCGSMDDIVEVAIECEAACCVRLTDQARDRIGTIGELVDAIMAAKLVPAPRLTRMDAIDHGKRRRRV